VVAVAASTGIKRIDETADASLNVNVAEIPSIAPAAAKIPMGVNNDDTKSAFSVLIEIKEEADVVAMVVKEIEQRMQRLDALPTLGDEDEYMPELHCCVCRSREFTILLECGGKHMTCAPCILMIQKVAMEKRRRLHCPQCRGHVTSYRYMTKDELAVVRRIDKVERNRAKSTSTSDTDIV
jgi:hypothetical protein